MDFGATVAVVTTVICFSCTLSVYFVSRNWGGRRKLEMEFKELRATLQSLNDLVRKLEGRLYNVETIVTGADFQASQRVARAVEESPRPAPPAPERQRVTN